MTQIMQWAGFIRDVGLILGVPTLIIIAMKLYDRQIEILKARNEFLKETQYDRASSLLDSQKNVFLVERESLESKIADLERSGSEKDETLAELQRRLAEVLERIQSLDKSKNIIDEARDKLPRLIEDLYGYLIKIEGNQGKTREFYEKAKILGTCSHSSYVSFAGGANMTLAYKRRVPQTLLEQLARELDLGLTTINENDLTIAE
jgi:hypothetical protein